MSSTSSSTYQCSACTYINCITLSCCSICSTSNPNYKSNTILPPNTIICTACTVIQSSFNTNCEVCESPLPLNNNNKQSNKSTINTSPLSDYNDIYNNNSIEEDYSDQEDQEEYQDSMGNYYSSDMTSINNNTNTTSLSSNNTNKPNNNSIISGRTAIAVVDKKLNDKQLKIFYDIFQNCLKQLQSEIKNDTNNTNNINNNCNGNNTVSHSHNTRRRSKSNNNAPNTNHTNNTNNSDKLLDDTHAQIIKLYEDLEYKSSNNKNNDSTNNHNHSTTNNHNNNNHSMSNSNNSNSNENGNVVECSVCYSECDGNKLSIVKMYNCNHAIICNECFNSYLTHKINDSEITPWIICPDPNCSIPLHYKDILSSEANLTLKQLLQFICEYMRKKIVRNENFICCKTKDCKAGFIQFKAKKETVKCELCNEKQVIEKGVDGELDKEFKDMIAKGTLRECPGCKLLTLKEKGLCNIIQCSKCGIVWNWRTKETGKTINELKQRARYNGSLWEPGELHFQQKLQRDNPKEFKALLERNGIKYDPSYVRGS